MFFSCVLSIFFNSYVSLPAGCTEHGVDPGTGPRPHGCTIGIGGLRGTGAELRGEGGSWARLFLVGGLVAINLAFSQKYWEFHHPNWRSHIFQRGFSPTTNQFWMGSTWDLPSGKHRKSYGKSPFFPWVNQLFLWAIFNGYVRLPEGNSGLIVFKRWSNDS